MQRINIFSFEVDFRLKQKKIKRYTNEQSLKTDEQRGWCIHPRDPPTGCPGNSNRQPGILQ
jgi:hypothetical protein